MGRISVIPTTTEHHFSTKICQERRHVTSLDHLFRLSAQCAQHIHTEEGLVIQAKTLNSGGV